MERWLPVDGFDGRYEVSEEGRVRGPRGLLYLYVDHGYVYVKLWKNGKRKNYRVNRLVALAFIPNPEAFPDVHHRNDNPLNNHAVNLQWMPHEENVRCQRRCKKSC